MTIKSEMRLVYEVEQYLLKNLKDAAGFSVGVSYELCVGRRFMNEADEVGRLVADGRIGPELNIELHDTIYKSFRDKRVVELTDHDKQIVNDAHEKFDPILQELYFERAKQDPILWTDPTEYS